MGGRSSIRRRGMNKRPSLRIEKRMGALVISDDWKSRALYNVFVMPCDWSLSRN